MKPQPPAWRRYLRFWGPNLDADIDDELRFHLEERERLFRAQGLSPEEARRAARERFGDVARVEDELRAHDHRRERGRQRRELMGDFVQDLTYGLRSLRRAPAFTAVAVLTLALGIGATTAIFSVVNAVILRPLPYPDADRVVMVWMDNKPQNMPEDIHSWPNYVDLRDQGKAFQAMAGFVRPGYNITGGCVEGSAACEPERVQGSASTASLFTVLGVTPAIGRAFTEEEETEGRDAVVVISHGLWTRAFGNAPTAIGKTLRMNGRERTVIGVMPKDVAFPAAETDVWVPLVVPEQNRQSRGYWLTVVGRLAPGITVERARTEMAALWKRMQEASPGYIDDYGLNLVTLPEQVVGKSLRTALWVMLAAVAAVLLIGCANVANLMLSRAAVREREGGVRLALGASRGRLVRQLLTESVLLSVLGGVLGVLLAVGGLRVLTGLAPQDIPRLDQVRVDGLVLAVTTLVVIATGVAFGLAPALQASRPNLSQALREGSRAGTGTRRSNQMRHALAAAQVALVVVLLTGAGLLIRSFVEIQRVRLGFRPDHLLTMRISLPGAKYQQGPQRTAFFEGLIQRVRALPGVEGVGATSSIFLSNTPRSTNVTIEGKDPRPEDRGIEVPIDVVTLDYFRVLGVPLVRGRGFTAQDARGAPDVVMINESMARRFWPGEDPVGKRFKYGGPQGQQPWMTVVGVVGDVRRTGFDAPVRYESFLPYAQNPDGALTLVVRTRGEPLALAAQVRGEVRALDADQPVFEIRSMDQLLSARIAQRRFSMALLGIFAGLALVLGVVGVYGVTSYLVAQRTREVGLRIALGAQPRQLVRMVVGQGMRSAAIGLTLGVLGALAAARLMAGLLYGVSPTDLPTLLGVTAVLAAATAVANWVPARRAARVDPLVALRAE